MSLTAAQAAYVGEVLALTPLVSFNEAERVFEVAEPRPSWAQVQELARVINRLRNSPPPPPFSGVTVARLEMGYFDRCLQRYLVQRLREGLPHEQTCWVRHAEKTFCLGRLEAGATLDDAARRRLVEDLPSRRTHVHQSVYRACRRDPSLLAALQADAEGWIYFKADIPIRSLHLRKRVRAAGTTLLRRIRRIPLEDRVVGIVRSIETRGWSNELARDPSASVLGHSRATGRYMAMTGRHRIAAARYCYEQGILDGATWIEVPILAYPWTSWLHGRPHPATPLCEACR